MLERGEVQEVEAGLGRDAEAGLPLGGRAQLLGQHRLHRHRVKRQLLAVHCAKK